MSEQGTIYTQDGSGSVGFKWDIPTNASSLPESLEINGVTYRRQGDMVDRQVNEIVELQAIADRTGLSFHQVYFIRTGSVLPT